MKQARIKCPHCGSQFIVRQSETGDMPPERLGKLWAATDEAFKAMDAAFAKIFHPSLWRW